MCVCSGKSKGILVIHCYISLWDRMFKECVFKVLLILIAVFEIYIWD